MWYIVCRNVGNNQFAWLPGSGLQRLLHLKAHNNPNLRRFHPPDVLPRIQVLHRVQCTVYSGTEQSVLVQRM